jgi:hypothetical protein
VGKTCWFWAVNSGKKDFMQTELITFLLLKWKQEFRRGKIFADNNLFWKEPQHL